MKTSLHILLAALAATAALAGCVQEITSPSFENDKVNPEGTRVIAVSFASQTKTILDGFQPRFEDGKDTVLISNTKALDTCVVSVDDKTKVATITTNLTGPLTAVYPYTAAKMNESNLNQIDTVLVSTVQSGKFADANICMARMNGENDESLSFDNKTALFKIIPGAGESTQYVEVSAKNFDIANDVPTGSTHTSLETIHVNTTTADSVYVSILVPENLTVGKLTFSDGTNVKTIKDERASTAIAAGTLYTVTNANWESTEADIPDGALKGVFSVSADKQVYFSQGNLVATINATGTPTDWKFATNQYDYIGETVANTSIGNTSTSGTAGDVDLFGWSTASTTYGINTSTNDSNYSGNFVDWGKAYCEENIITPDNTWRTLSTEEWQYLFNYGSYTSEVRNGKYKYGVTVCSKANCVVLLPDGWKWEGDVGTEWQTEYPETQTNNEVTWQKMEDAGAVCLPAAGIRNGSDVDDVGDYGYYWSSTAFGSDYAYLVYFNSSNVYPGYNDYRYLGYSVRLVTDVSAAPTPTTEQSLVLGPDMIITKTRNGEPKPGIDNVTYPWVEYVNPTSEPLDDGTAEVQQSNRWTNLNPETGEIGDWIQVTGKNGSVRSPVLNPTYGRYLIFSVQNIYGMQVFATGSASGSAADGNYLKLTATSDDGEVIEASTTPGTIYGTGNSSDFCTINLNPKKSYEVKAEAAVKEIQVLGIKLINEIS